MSKMHERALNTTVWSVCLLSSSFVACALDRAEIQLKGECDKESVAAVRTILSLDSFRSSRTLILSDRVCRVCLDEVIATLGTRRNTKKVSILIIGKDPELAKQLTSIYRRQNIPFNSISKKAYDALLASDASKVMSSIFVGVKEESAKEFYLYDGKRQGKTSHETTLNRLSFLLDESIRNDSSD